MYNYDLASSHIADKSLTQTLQKYSGSENEIKQFNINIYLRCFGKMSGCIEKKCVFATQLVPIKACVK